MKGPNKSFQLVELKIAETHYFYTKLTDDDIKAFHKQFYFSAFISAARSITFCNQYVYSDIKGFKEWWENLISNFVTKNNILNSFNHMRVDAIHKGINPLAFNMEFLYFENKSDIMYIFENENVTTMIDALCQCKEYLLVLLFISFEVYIKWGKIIDSDEYVKHNNWIDLGRILNRNVFNYMGVPHNWRHVPYGYTDAKMFPLDETIPRTIIDEVIEQLLGIPVANS